MDLEIEKKYAFQQGQEQKAIEAAIVLIHDFNVSPEIAAQKMNAPLEKVLELQNKIPVKA